MQKAVRDTETAADNMERTVSRMAVGFGVALMASVPAMAASFIPLENALARLETVSTPVFQTMKQVMAESLDSAREWSSQHVQSTTDIIQAQFEMATAGLNNAQALKGVATAAGLATATGDDLIVTTRSLASWFNTLGEAGKGTESFEEFFKKAGDASAEAIKRFQMVMPALREGMSFVVAQMKEAGLTGSEAFGEAATALGILNTAGLRAGVAGAALQNVFMRLPQAVKELNLDVNAFTDSAGRITSITDIMEEVRKKVEEGRTPFEQLTAANEAFGIRGAKAALILSQQVDVLREQSKAVNGASGALQRMQGIMERTTGSQLTIAMNQLKNFSQAAGETLAPALVVLAKAAQEVFGALAAWVGKVGVWAPVIIFVTGATMTFIGALGVLRIMLAATGATAAAQGVAIAAFGRALLSMSLIGLAVFAGLTIISALLAGGEKFKPRLFDQMDQSKFRPIEDSIKSLAKEWKDLQDLVARGAKGPEIEIRFTAVKEGVVKAVAGAAEAMGLAAAKALDMGSGAAKAIEELTKMGVAADDAALSVAKMSSKLLTGGMIPEDAAKKVQEISGSLKEAETRFVALANAAGMAGKTGTEALNSLREHLKEGGFGVGAGAVRTEDIKRMIESWRAGGLENEGLGAAFKSWSEAAALMGQTINAVMEDVAKSSPEMAKAWKEATEGLDFNSDEFLHQTFERMDSGKLEEIGKGFWTKLWNGFGKRDNDITGIEVLAPAIDKLFASFSEKLKSAPAIKDFGIAQGMKDEMTRLGENLTNAKNQYTTVMEEMKKHVTPSGIQEAVEWAKKIDEILVKMGTDASQGESAVTSALKAIGDATRNTPEEALGKTLVAFFAQGKAAAAQARGEVDEYVNTLRLFRAVVGDQDLNKEALKVGGDAFSKALEASLLTGSFDAFKKKLFEGAYDSLEKGIIQGVQVGLLAASHLGEIFKPEAIAKRIQDALGAGADPAKGTIDPEKSKAAMKKVVEEMKVEWESGLKTIKPLWDVVQQVFQSANTDIFGTLFSDKQTSAIDEMTKAMREQEKEVGQLRASLFTATDAQRDFIQAQIAFSRGSGAVFGQDVGKLDISGKIALLQDLITNAKNAGQGAEVKAFTDLLAKQFEALEKISNTKPITDALAHPAEEAAAAFGGMTGEAAKLQIGLDGIQGRLTTIVSTARDGEAAFREWYSSIAALAHIDPNPYAPEHHYNMKAMFEAMMAGGQGPSVDPTDSRIHFPSGFKEDDHPRRWMELNGVLVDTKKHTADIADEVERARDAAEFLGEVLKKLGDTPALLPAHIGVSGTPGGSSITVNVGSTAITVEAGAAVTEADLDTLRKQLDAEYQKKREEIVQMLRLASGSRK